MTLTSPAFKQGQPIPEKYSCDGEDFSPPLKWSAPPEGTVSFILICEDPDAPMGTWVHWVYFNIPAETTELPEALHGDVKHECGGLYGKNSWERNDYCGPCPPGGTHHYYFRLYALSAVLYLKTGADKARVMNAIKAHQLADTELMGTYSR